MNLKFKLTLKLKFKLKIVAETKAEIVTETETETETIVMKLTLKLKLSHSVQEIFVKDTGFRKLEFVVCCFCSIETYFVWSDYGHSNNWRDDFDITFENGFFYLV